MHRTVRALSLLAVAASILWLGLPAGAQVTIESDGPLEQIIIGPDLSCQVRHTMADDYQFAPPDSAAGHCGTFIAWGEPDGQRFLSGPSFLSDAAGQGAVHITPYVPVSGPSLTGSGAPDDPYVVSTVVVAGPLELEQTDTYVNGSESYTTRIRVKSQWPGHMDVDVWRAGDCHLIGGGASRGILSAGEWVSCDRGPAFAPHHIIWTAGEPADVYERRAEALWQQIAARKSFDDSCACTLTSIDGAAGLSWFIHLDMGDVQTISHTTTFSATPSPPPPSVEPPGEDSSITWPPARIECPCVEPEPVFPPSYQPTPSLQAGAVSGDNAPLRRLQDSHHPALAGDADRDGVPDIEDLCLGVADPTNVDSDGDGIGDACSDDDDGDGIPDALDACPTSVSCTLPQRAAPDVQGGAMALPPAPDQSAPEEPATVQKVHVVDDTPRDVRPALTMGIVALCLVLLLAACLRPRVR